MLKAQKIRKLSTYICYALSYAYIIAASQNDGFSGAFFAIPFVLFLVVSSIKAYRHNNKLLLANCIFLLMAGFMYLSDRSDWSIIYPAIGKDIIAVKDTTISHDNFFPFTINGYKPEGIIYDIKEGDRFTIINQFVTGNPDFGVSYVYRVQPSNKKFEEEFIKNAGKKNVNWYAVGEKYKPLPINLPYFSMYQMLYDGFKFPTFDHYSYKYMVWNVLEALLIYIFLLPAYFLFGIACWVSSREPSVGTH